MPDDKTRVATWICKPPDVVLLYLCSAKEGVFCRLHGDDVNAIWSNCRPTLCLKDCEHCPVRFECLTTTTK
jgi:hypothetical protein